MDIIIWIGLTRKRNWIYSVTLNRNSIILWFCTIRLRTLTSRWRERKRCTSKVILNCPRMTKLPMCLCPEKGQKKEVYVSMPHGHLMTLSLGSFFCSPDVSIRRHHDCSLHAESSWNKRGLMSSIQITAKFFLTQDA